RTASEFFEVPEVFKQAAAESAAAVASGGRVGKFISDNAAAPVSRAAAIVGRAMMGEHVPEDEMFETLVAEHSIIVGTPDECRKKVKTYQEMGIDRLMCLHQVGAIRHDKVMKSMRLFSELIPEFDR